MGHVRWAWADQDPNVKVESIQKGLQPFLAETLDLCVRQARIVAPIDSEDVRRLPGLKIPAATLCDNGEREVDPGAILSRLGDSEPLE
jgi:hypothetical protein